MTATTPATPTPAIRVEWRRVALYYAIAFGGAVGVALLIWALRLALPAATATTVGLAVTAVLYMPLPLVAGLILERVHHRRPLIAEEWQTLRHSFWRTYGRNALAAVAVSLAVIGAGLAMAWLAGALQLPGAGHLVTSEAELRQQMMAISPTITATTPIPPAYQLALITLAQGILAGLTINGLFAFGEEYGWRGVLAAELRPLGPLWANLVTGLLWGFWHAPIIILGHNYGSQWGWGIPVMITWCVPLSFLLSWVRERTGSVLAPALLHGAYNGTFGIFLFIVVGGNIMIAVPLGVLMALTLTVLAAGLWLARPHPAAAPGL